MRHPTTSRLTYRELSLLGLKEHPFHPSADPRFLYLSRNHLNILGRLQDLIEWREGLAVVEGHMGTGKDIPGPPPVRTYRTR